MAANESVEAVEMSRYEQGRQALIGPV